MKQWRMQGHSKGEFMVLPVRDAAASLQPRVATWECGDARITRHWNFSRQAPHLDFDGKELAVQIKTNKKTIHRKTGSMDFEFHRLSTER